MVKKITKAKIIAQYISNYDRKYYLRELASLLKKPHQTIKPYVEELVKEGILTKDARKNIVEYGLNFKHKGVYDYLVIAEKEKLIEKTEDETILKILYEKLSPYFADNIFLIFGSSVNKIEKRSDIDLLVIVRTNINKIAHEFEEVYNKKIHKIQIAELKRLTPALTKEIYKKHLILSNTEQIVRFFGEQHEQNKLL
jgi:predicted nucleotidyltransferase